MIKMKLLGTIIISSLTALAAHAASINVTPGSLENIIKGGAISGEATVALKGAIDARDMAAFSQLPASVRTLDLRDVTINSLTSPNKKYFGRTLFAGGEIPAYVFFSLPVESVVLPASVVFVDEGAFAGSAVKNLQIPEGVTSLGDYALYGCSALESVTLPSTLQILGKGALGNCTGLKTVNLGNTRLTEIPERAFAGCTALENVTLPATVTKIGREAFSHTAIKSLSLAQIKDFEPYALSGMGNLAELTINPSANIEEGLLMDNVSLKSLIGVPDYVPAYFGANTGLDANLVASKAGVLGPYSMANTLSSKITLGDGVVKIERGAFAGLSSLEEIDAVELGGNIPEVDEYSFETLDPPSITLWVEDNYIDSWQADPVWSRFNIKPSSLSAVDAVADGLGADRIEISRRAGLLTFDALSAITDVRVFTTDGRVAYLASPGESHFELSTSDLPSGVVIITAADAAGNTRTLTMIL